MNPNAMQQGMQFQSAPKAPRAAGNKTGVFGGAAKPTPNKTKPPVSGRKYDTATNSFRPTSKKVGQGSKLNGKGHDGKFGAPDGGPARDGRVGGTGPAPQSDFLSSGAGDSQPPMTPKGGKIGQGKGLAGKGVNGQSGKKIGNPRVGG